MPKTPLKAVLRQGAAPPWTRWVAVPIGKPLRPHGAWLDMSVAVGEWGSCWILVTWWWILHGEILWKSTGVMLPSRRKVAVDCEKSCLGPESRSATRHKFPDATWSVSSQSFPFSRFDIQPLISEGNDGEMMETNGMSPSSPQLPHAFWIWANSSQG
jgi:hypothetical protein